MSTKEEKDDGINWITSGTRKKMMEEGTIIFEK
jgi:hypothetical protein